MYNISKNVPVKKIIYSIVSALILSVILSVLIPEWLFKGDALWTYRNDAARLNVSFSGRLKNARVNTEGSDLEISQPAWFSNGYYQGTVVVFPVSYRKKTYQIKFTPQAEEWGKDASLVIEFKCRDFRYNGKREPAWVSFQNITLNGQHMEGEKIVRYDKPFVLKCPPHSPELTLTFDVCKPFAAFDISYVNLLLVFSTFLLLNLIFAFPQMVESYIPEFIYKRDIVSYVRRIISDGYSRIDPVYRHSFWIILGVLCCAFGFHTIWFMWGNHDWGLMTGTSKWYAHAYEGRYMVFSVKALLSRGVYLPLIYDAIIFVTLALNAVLLCRYWRLEKRVIYYVLCGLVLVAQPFTLSMMYFVNMTPEAFIGVTCILTALLLSGKTSTGGGYISYKLVCSLLSIVLINCALATYPVLLNTISVVFVGRMLVQAFDWDGSGRQLRSYIRPYTISAIHIISGIVLYKLIITFVFPVQNLYNTKMLPLAQVPKRLGILLKQSFHQLYEYDMPFLSQWIMWVFLGFTVILTFHICYTGNVKQKIVRLFVLFSSLFATQAIGLISYTHIIIDRVETFGLVFFEVLVMAVVFTHIRKFHNFSVIAGACVIVVSVLHDLDCLRVWKLGFEAEEMHWNRVLARLEMQKGFDPTKKYDVVQVGRSVSIRPHYYTGQPITQFLPLLSQGYDPNFSVFSAHEFFYPTRFRKRGISSYNPAQHRDYVARLKRLYQAGVLQKAEVWPKPNGLIVWKDIILFVTDGIELERYKRQFERELGKE